MSGTSKTGTVVRGSGGGAVYGLGLIGALVYYWQGVVVNRLGCGPTDDSSALCWSVYSEDRLTGRLTPCGN